MSLLPSVFATPGPVPHTIIAVRPAAVAVRWLMPLAQDRDAAGAPGPNRPAGHDLSIYPPTSQTAQAFAAGRKAV